MSESRRLTLYFAPPASVDAHLYRTVRKILKQQARAVVRCADWEHTEYLTKVLWTAGGNSFVPHGNSDDGFADKQPIWLTDKNDNPNKASFLITFAPVLLAQPDDMPTHEHCLCFADETDSQKIDSDSQLWQTCQKLYNPVTAYRYQQDRWQSCDKPETL